MPKELKILGQNYTFANIKREFKRIKKTLGPITNALDYELTLFCWKRTIKDYKPQQDLDLRPQFYVSEAPSKAYNLIYYRELDQSVSNVSIKDALCSERVRYSNYVRAAFRAEIAEQVLEFKKQYLLERPRLFKLMEAKKLEMHVDHAGEKPFALVRDAFLDQERLSILNVKTAFDPVLKRWVFADGGFAQRWKTYHQKVTEYSVITAQDHRIKTSIKDLPNIRSKTKEVNGENLTYAPGCSPEDNHYDYMGSEEDWYRKPDKVVNRYVARDMKRDFSQGESSVYNEAMYYLKNTHLALGQPVYKFQVNYNYKKFYKQNNAKLHEDLTFNSLQEAELAYLKMSSLIGIKCTMVDPHIEAEYTFKDGIYLDTYFNMEEEKPIEQVFQFSLCKEDVALVFHCPVFENKEDYPDEKYSYVFHDWSKKELVASFSTRRMEESIERIIFESYV